MVLKSKAENWTEALSDRCVLFAGAMLPMNEMRWRDRRHVWLCRSLGVMCKMRQEIVVIECKVMLHEERR